MSTAAKTTSYAVEGRLLEVCTWNVRCPCWVGEDPDGDGTCDSILGWYVDRGTVVGVDVSDRCLCLSVHIPGNVLAGNWRAGDWSTTGAHRSSRSACSTCSAVGSVARSPISRRSSLRSWPSSGYRSSSTSSARGHIRLGAVA